MAPLANHSRNALPQTQLATRHGAQSGLTWGISKGIGGVWNRFKGRKVVHVDIGGEGRYPGAINVNPATETSTTGTPGRTIPNRIEGAIENLPLPNEYADIVTIENTPLRYGAPAEIARVVKRGGIIRMSHPSEVALNRTSRTVIHQDVIDALPPGATVLQTTVGGDIITVIIVPGGK